MDIQDYSRGRDNTNSKLAFQQAKVTIPKMQDRVLNEVDGIRSTIEIANPHYFRTVLRAKSKAENLSNIIKKDRQ